MESIWDLFGNADEVIGFPLEQKFGDTSAKKQIGNAVPPIVAASILGEVRRWLEKVDGVERREERERRGEGRGQELS